MTRALLELTALVALSCIAADVALIALAKALGLIVIVGCGE